MRDPTARVAWVFALVLSMLSMGCGTDPKARSTHDSADEATDEPAPFHVSFAPYWQWIGPGVARLRVETLEDVQLNVTIRRDGTDETVPMVGTAVDLTHFWPTPEGIEEFEHNDLPGPHVLHEVVLSDVGEGEVIGWQLDLGMDPIEGTLTGPPAPGGAFRALFVGDTMSPFSDGVFQAAGTTLAELVLHGGDMQYQSNPADTWEGLSWAMMPVNTAAAMHPSVGNHEQERNNEMDEMYRRLFVDIGTDVPPMGADYYRLDHGGVRFLALDSEADALEHQLTAPDSIQLAWLEAELLDAADDPNIVAVVPFFHRPIYTLAAHGPQTEMRAVLHPLFVEHGVKLVLQAHNHSYERMVADGITYITDGGGGALLSDITAQLEAIPEEVELRQAASQTFGFTVLDFDDGTVALTRFDDDGVQVDAATVSLR